MAKTFASLMLRGKVRAALRLLSQHGSAGVLDLDKLIEGKTVREILMEKHPPAQPVTPGTLLSPTAHRGNETHPVLLDRIDGELVRSMALKTQGAAGPSGMDAVEWRRMCSSSELLQRSLQCHCRNGTMHLHIVRRSIMPESPHSLLPDPIEQGPRCETHRRLRDHPLHNWQSRSHCYQSRHPISCRSPSGMCRSRGWLRGCHPRDAGDTCRRGDRGGSLGRCQECIQLLEQESCTTQLPSSVPQPRTHPDQHVSRQC